MSRPDDGTAPARLDDLLDGRAAPETEEERMLLALAADLRASEPDLPASLDRRIDHLLREDAPARARRRGWWPGAWGKWTLSLGPAAVAAAAVIAVVVTSGGGLPAWKSSPELVPAVSDQAATAPLETMSGAPSATAPAMAPAGPDTPTPSAPVPEQGAPADPASPPPGPPPPAASPSAPTQDTPRTSSTPAPAPFFATVRAGGLALVVRDRPASDAARVAILVDGTSVAALCATDGGAVLGPDGTSTRWLRLEAGGYASQAFLVPDLPAGEAAPDC